MTGFTDLVAQAQPALAVVHARATEGRSWRFVFEVTDDTDTAVDLSGVTGTCTVWDSDTDAEVTTLAVSGTVGGEIIATKAPGASAGLAGSGDSSKRCRWGLVLVSATAEQCQVWGPTDSTFIIDHEEA